MDINSFVEEQQKQLGDINHNINNIDINYSGVKVNKLILDHLTSSIKQSTNFK